MKEAMREFDDFWGGEILGWVRSIVRESEFDGDDGSYIGNEH
jgi:hypothetical protein